VYADHRDQHHQDDQDRADGAEETYRRREAPAHFAEAGREREEPTRSKPETIEVAASSPEAVAAEPPEELLCP
jgi:hypothetical protein